MSSMPRAAIVSAFLKWMRSTYIPNFRQEMELGANYLLEKGIMVTYVGWKRESRTFKQTVTLQQISQLMPEMVDLILSGTNDEEVVALLQQAFPAISKKRAKSVVKDLRRKGIAEVPIPRNTVDCPVAYTCAPDGEVLFPSYCSDPQRAPTPSGGRL